MKRLITLVLVLGLTVLAPLSALGAIHDSAGDFGDWYWPNILGAGWLNFGDIKVDHWFTVAKDSQYWKAVMNLGGVNVDNQDMGFLSGTQIAGEYYCNDQSFAEITLNWLSDDEMDAGNFTSAKGTYLAASNFFFGLNYGSGMGQSISVLSGGYKFKLNDSNYLAFSLDYGMLDPNQITADDGPYTSMALDVDFKYFTSTGKTKMVGQGYIMNDDYFGDMTQIDFKLNHQINNQWVIGGFVGFHNAYDSFGFLSDDFNDATLYGAGFTFAPTEWVVDAMFTVVDEDGVDETTLTELSAMHAMNNQLRIGAGLNLYSGVDDPEILAKLVWLVGGGNFDMAFRLPTDVYDSMLFLGYKKALK